MIISEKHNYVNISIPKTASVSTREWLTTHCDGRLIADHHACDASWYSDAMPLDCIVFAVVREPYARCYSLWKWETHTALQGGMLVESSCGFEAFLHILVQYQRCAPNVYMTQVEYTTRARVNHVIHFENLPGELATLSFGKPHIEHFPHKNPNSRIGLKPSINKYYNKKTEALVWEYCRADFETFGYERIVM